MALGAERLAARQNAIIDVAEQLIRRTHTTDFTMLEVATGAGVSAGTPYNLFETKAGLLYALLSRSMDGIEAAGADAEQATDPFDRIGAAAQAAARFYATDPYFYRALYRFLLGVDDPVHRPAIMQRAYGYWERATVGLAARKVFTPELRREDFVFQLTTNFLGITDLWIHGELGNDAYVARVTHGANSLLLAVARGKARERISGTMSELLPKLTAV